MRYSTNFLGQFLFTKLVLTLLTLIPTAIPFHFWKRIPSITRSFFLYGQFDTVDSTNFVTKDHDRQKLARTFQINENDDKKLAWARHTVMTIAASVMGVPSDVFTTPPMEDPRPPTTSTESDIRKRVDDLLMKGYPDPLSGFEIPSEEMEFINQINDSNDSGHNPSTYGEITFLGSRQLFHYMGISGNLSKKPISFIDLGSGNGKLVVQAFLEVPKLASVQGIELSPSRHDFALKSWNGIQREAREIRLQTLSSHGMENFSDKQRDVVVSLSQGDLFETDISEATHIYVASLCFTDEMMDALGNKIKSEGRNLNHVATLKPFEMSFEKEAGYVREARYVEMSWTKPRGIGGVVYFYSKI